jgi:hypothetical protein
MEAMKGRQQLGGGAGSNNNRAVSPSVRPHQMTPQELHEAQSPQDQFSPDETESQQGGNIFEKKVHLRLCILTFVMNSLE